MLCNVVLKTDFNGSAQTVRKTKQRNHSLSMGFVTTMLTFMDAKFEYTQQKLAAFPQKD